MTLDAEYWTLDTEMLSTYMITGSSSTERVVAHVVRALDAGVARVQVRRKGAAAADIERLVQEVVSRRTDARGKLLINDRLDVALATEVGGVHLPADGLDAEKVRCIAPRGFEIAVSVHDVDAARRAARAGADFIVYGPVFPTRSKPGHPGVGGERLREVVSAVAIPVYALGGITSDNVGLAARAGASGVAAIAAFESERSFQELMACLP